MTNATNKAKYIRGDIGGGCTYIHGSVDESPSGDLVRSLERPGAKTPRPYPRMETHHGSFTVNLDPPVIGFDTQFTTKENHSPVFYAVPERFEANPGVANKVLGNFIFVQPTTVTVVETLREIPVIQCLCRRVGESSELTRRCVPPDVCLPRRERFRWRGAR